MIRSSKPQLPPKFEYLTEVLINARFNPSDIVLTSVTTICVPCVQSSEYQSYVLIELTIYKCKKTKKARPVAICFTYKKNCQFTCALSQVQKCRITEQKHGYLPQSFLHLGLVSLSIWFGQFLTLKFSFHTDMSELLYHVMLHWRSEFLECMCVIYRNMMHSSHVRHFTDTGMRGNGIVLYLEKLSSCADRFI